MLLPSRDALERRVLSRAAQHTHFMPPTLLADQLATLELPPTAEDFFFCLSGAPVLIACAAPGYPQVQAGTQPEQTRPRGLASLQQVTCRPRM